jgi:wyosine [tRNA(Phe)-imidazoG37] synthetase (radical SAM superfamily)
MMKNPAPSPRRRFSNLQRPMLGPAKEGGTHVENKVAKTAFGPVPSRRLGRILEGLSEFTRVFKGELATETMLIQGFNDCPEEIEKISVFVAGLKPKKSYISVPIRPPAEKWVHSPDEHSLNLAHQVFSEKLIDTELLIGYEGNAFSFTGNVEEDLLSIMSVHPMREDAVHRFLKKAKADPSTVRKLVKAGKLVEIQYRDWKFYVRKLPNS